MPLDLDALAPVVEQYMFDTIEITRTPTMDEAVLDEGTGQYVTPAPAVIYSGKAWVAAIGTPAGNLRAMEDLARVQYEVGIPKAGGEVFKPLDVILVLSSKFDPSLAGERLELHGEIVSTFTVMRRLTAYLDVSRSVRND